MKVAVIGSRSLNVYNIERFLPPGITEIITGGSKGAEACAREYARDNGIKLKTF